MNLAKRIGRWPEECFSAKKFNNLFFSLNQKKVV